MSAATAILDYVGRVGKIDRDALIAEIEREHDPKVVSPTVSTMLRRGELKELANGHIALGSEESIEQARQEREQRKANRDRTKMPPPSPTPHVAAVHDKPRQGSHPTAVAICSNLQTIVDKHGPLRAADINRRLDSDLGSLLYYHLGAMVERGELLKRGALYGTSPEQFEPRNKPDMSAATPPPIVNVAAVEAKSEKESRADTVEKLSSRQLSDARATAVWYEETYGPEAVLALLARFNVSKVPEIAPADFERFMSAAIEKLSPSTDGPQIDTSAPGLIPRILRQPSAPACRIKSIADVARKHASAAPEEHVLQLGDVYIAVTAPAEVATRVLSAALAVLGAPA